MALKDHVSSLAEGLQVPSTAVHAPMASPAFHAVASSGGDGPAGSDGYSDYDTDGSDSDAYDDDEPGGDS